MERREEIEVTELPPARPDTTNIVKEAFIGDAVIRAKGKIPLRELSIVRDEEIPYLIAMEIMGDSSGADPYKMFVELFLRYRISTGAGRGRKDLLRAEQVSHGIAVRTMEETHQPGWFARNFTNRNWEQKERERILREGGDIG